MGIDIVLPASVGLSISMTVRVPVLFAAEKGV